MYMSVTANDIKDQIVKSICDLCGTLHIVLCTVASGIGLDCLAHIVHWGPSTDLEGYVYKRLGEEDIMGSYVTVLSCISQVR